MSIYRLLLKFMTIGFITVLTGLLIAGDEESNDWPTWRGKDQTGHAYTDGMFKLGNGNGLKIAWKKPLGSGYSSVSVSNGQLVTMFSDSTFDYVISFDTDGNELWQLKIDSTYIGHDGSHNGPISTPVIDDGRVFVLGPKGHLLALELENGKKLWEKDLVIDFNSLAPFYGFATAPMVYDDQLIIETGAKDGTISALSKETGDLLWSAGSDTVNYQSPIAVELAGQEQLLCVGDKYIYGLAPRTGKKLWEFRYDGDGASSTPVVVGKDKVMLSYKFQERLLLQIKNDSGQLVAEEVWKTRDLKNTYDTSVYKDGHIYGYSGRFLTCIDAETGEKVWRSREPGDGFIIIVDDYLVIQTKEGTLHVAEVSPAGYREVASANVFDGVTWTPPSFASGRLYLRNLYEIASVEVGEVDQLVMAEDEPEMIVAPNSAFSKFIDKVENATDKKALIDDFMQNQKSFPVIENKSLVHFIYRGEAVDMAIAGDLFEAGEQQVFKRIPDTDFYYYTAKVEPDAVISYQLIKDFENNITDPLNERSALSFNGNSSVLFMPDSAPENHLISVSSVKSKIDSIHFESEIMENSRTLKVYLPAGYEDSSQRYPVTYVHYGQQAMNWGKIPTTLDNLIGKEIDPVIVVFIHLSPLGFREVSGQEKDQYAEMLANELVSFIDEKYRTIAKPEARAMFGQSSGGFISLYTAFKHPGVFGKLGGQSANVDPPRDEELITLVTNSDKLPIDIFLHWGKYDIRSESNNLNRAGVNQKLYDVLIEKGYSVHGGEMSHGYGFGSWQTVTDDIFKLFFPIKTTQK